ncbi:hypothetical protein [Sphingorhabdus sp. SMR4y]|uniref:hypothetical protein n=1 Tax=Sphingorhabdus sp. SMR4y TaxID=2584094 RepID=UPI000B61DFE8|nr:hypothetical protein [Sphingorhabdus sp. SMR4y]ASK89987.1 hypothetical protein SPHFLASMR4Y_03260 [Sphingorhabdus sp. SMR4y]
MISSLAYAIILMGCSDDMSLCREMARDERRFATLAECKRSEGKALQSDVALALDYPVVASKCTAGTERFARKGTKHIGG